MKADWSDAPKYIRAKSSRNSSVAWLIPGVIGVAITLGGLQLIGSTFLQSTVTSLTEKSTPTKKNVQKMLIKSQQVTSQDWDRIVEEQAKRNSEAPTTLRQLEDKSTLPLTKQTVFNDQNYLPRGADNVLSFKEPSHPIENPEPPNKVRVTIVEQTPSKKDQVCWPLKEGSIEHRNCQLNVGLKYRD